MKSEIKLFEQQKVRTHWDDKEEKWYFSVIDVIAILTGSVNPRDYWFKMKASDGKMRETDAAETIKQKE
jgi:glucan-binding YG repeat protein